MAVLEIQANGDTAVSKEAIVNAGQSLEDPLMRVSTMNTHRWKHKDKLSHITPVTLPPRDHLGSRLKSHRAGCFPQEFTQSCLRHEAKLRPTAHDLLFHRVLFEVHSLKLLAAHCLINNQCEFLNRRRTPSCAYQSLPENPSENQTTESTCIRSADAPTCLLHLQICSQKIVWRRKPSPSTPTPSWRRSSMTTERECSSSKISHAPPLFLSSVHEYREKHSAHCGPLCVSSRPADIPTCPLWSSTSFWRMWSKCGDSIRIGGVMPQHEAQRVCPVPSSGMGSTPWWTLPRPGLTLSPEPCPCPRSRWRRSRRRRLNPRRQNRGRWDEIALNKQQPHIWQPHEILNKLSDISRMPVYDQLKDIFSWLGCPDAL